MVLFKGRGLAGCGGNILDVSVDVGVVLGVVLGDEECEDAEEDVDEGLGFDELLCFGSTGGFPVHFG